MSETEKSVGETHAAAGLITQIDPNAEEVCGTGRFTALATDAVFRTRRGCDLTSLATIPRHHLKHIERAGANALGATDAGVVDLDGVGHALAITEPFRQGTRALAVRPPERQPRHRC